MSIAWITILMNAIGAGSDAADSRNASGRMAVPAKRGAIFNIARYGVQARRRHRK